MKMNEEISVRISNFMNLEARANDIKALKWAKFVSGFSSRALPTELYSEKRWFFCTYCELDNPDRLVDKFRPDAKELWSKILWCIRLFVTRTIALSLSLLLHSGTLCTHNKSFKTEKFLNNFSRSSERRMSGARTFFRLNIIFILFSRNAERFFMLSRAKELRQNYYTRRRLIFPFLAKENFQSFTISCLAKSSSCLESTFVICVKFNILKNLVMSKSSAPAFVRDC